MKLLHFIGPDELLGKRVGLIIERAGRVEAVHLMLSFTGKRRRLFFVDFRNAVAVMRPHYFVRIAWYRDWYTLSWHWHFDCCWGVQPDPAAKLAPTGRSVKVYESESW